MASDDDIKNTDHDDEEAAEREEREERDQDAVDTLDAVDEGADAGAEDEDTGAEDEDAEDEDAEDEDAGNEDAEDEAEPPRQASEPPRQASEPPRHASEPPRRSSSRPPPRGEAEEAPPPPEKRPALYLAEFEDPDSLVHAVEGVRDAGYEKWDVHTPYPVHGLDEAMGLPTTQIGWISFAAGMLGVISAVAMMQWMNGFDYPLIIGGKPPDAYTSMVPIMFELGVLLCGFGTVFGLLHLCKLPRHHHPVFYSDRFKAASDDRFFVSIEVADPSFDLAATRALLESLHPSHLELVEEEVS